MNTQTSFLRGEPAKGGPRTKSSGANTIRVLLAALVFAALAASSAATSGHLGGHVAHSLIGSGYISNTPWMY